jgi:hypothetical protein
MNYSVFAESVPMFWLCVYTGIRQECMHYWFISLSPFPFFLLIYLSCRFVCSLWLLSLSFTFISPILKLRLHKELVLWIPSYFVLVNDCVDISSVLWTWKITYVKLLRVRWAFQQQASLISTLKRNSAKLHVCESCTFRTPNGERQLCLGHKTQIFQFRAWNS